jgi:AraC-like DNA-binding protein
VAATYDGSVINFYVNGGRYSLKHGTTHVLLPGDIHAERFYKASVGYQVFWIHIVQEYVGFQVSCYEPNRGYYLLGKQICLTLESRQELLSIGHCPQFHDDPLTQVRFHSKLMEILLESLPLIRQVPDQQSKHIPYTGYLVEQIKHHLDSHFREDITLPELGRIFHYSPSYLSILFRKKYGLPILQYILHKRIDLAERLLQTTDLEIKQVSFQAGFNDPLYFSRIFRQIKKRSPSEDRKK